MFVIAIKVEGKKSNTWEYLQGPDGEILTFKTKAEADEYGVENGLDFETIET